MKFPDEEIPGSWDGGGIFIPELEKYITNTTQIHTEVDTYNACFAI